MPFLVDDLDAIFLAMLERLQEVTTANGEAACLVGQRRWFIPPLNSWSGDPNDVTGINSAFDRVDLNQLYRDVVSDTQQRGRQGEAMVLKLQVDYLAALERAFRTRNASSVRCKLHAASRQKGHGSSSGLFDNVDGNVVVWLRRLLSAAQYDPPGA